MFFDIFVNILKFFLTAGVGILVIVCMSAFYSRVKTPQERKEKARKLGITEEEVEYMELEEYQAQLRKQKLAELKNKPELIELTRAKLNLKSGQDVLDYMSDPANKWHPMNIYHDDVEFPKPKPKSVQTYVSPIAEAKKHEITRAKSTLKEEKPIKKSKPKPKEKIEDKPYYDENRYCSVEFHKDGKTYTYKCPNTSIKAGDYVRVDAQGKEKTVRVYSIFNHNNTNMQITKFVLRKANLEETKAVIYEFEPEDYDYYDDYWKEHMSLSDRYKFERFALVDLPGYNHAELYLCHDDNILEGDKVLVKTKLCEEEAEVVGTYYFFVLGLPKDVIYYDDVIRKVADNPDVAAREAAKRREYDAWIAISDKAKEMEQSDVLLATEEACEEYEEMQVRELEAGFAMINKALSGVDPLSDRMFNPTRWTDPINVYYDD